MPMYISLNTDELGVRGTQSVEVPCIPVNDAQVYNETRHALWRIIFLETTPRVQFVFRWFSLLWLMRVKLKVDFTRTGVVERRLSRLEFYVLCTTPVINKATFCFNLSSKTIRS